jgi:hypothetical protein
MRQAIAWVLAMSFSAPALAERTIPYASLHAMFSRIAVLQGGTYFKADARLTSTDPAVPTEALQLVIQSRGGAIRVPVAADGTTQFPIRADLLAENPPVLTNAAEGKLSLSVSLRVEAPPTQRFRYGLMVAMHDEARAMIAKQGMMARMLAPDFEGLRITFPAGTAATATLETAQGPVRFETDAAHVIRIPDRRKWRREDPFVQLSAMPLEISLDVD